MWISIIFYFWVLVLAFGYGLHRGVLVWRFFRYRRPLPKKTDGFPGPGGWPEVLVQLPVYNEGAVVADLLKAISHLDYPREALWVQVLDDSDDGSEKMNQIWVEKWKKTGLNVVHCHRKNRQGFKAGALAAGLAATKQDFIAVFDADFLPAENFLKRLLRRFEDPRIGMVQAAWSHHNRGTSLLTQAQAILLDGHFRIENAARCRSGLFFNFNGSAGMWRRQAIEDAGGWHADTLTEDLDLSYRAQLQGWRFWFEETIDCAAELPTTMAALRTQQQRWAKGSIETAAKILVPLLRAPLSRRVRLEGFLHLTNNLCYALIFMAALLFPWTLVWRQMNEARLVFAGLFFLPFLAVQIYFLCGQTVQGRGWFRRSLAVPLATLLCIGLSAHNFWAVLEALLRKRSPFHRTPKQGRGEPRRPWSFSTGIGRVGPVIWEGALVVYYAFAVWLCVLRDFFVGLPFALCFFAGFGLVFCRSLQDGFWGCLPCRPLDINPKNVWVISSKSS